jgi:hypothetical protein
MKKKTFRAQALAIVMVVLVVASIIGISLFSRIAKDRDAAIDQQDSSISATQVDAILDLFVGADLAQLESVLGEEDTYHGPFDDLGDLAEFLENGAIVEDASMINADWCPGENNNIEVGIDYADDEDLLEVQLGSVMAYNLEGANITDGADQCKLNVSIGSVEDDAVFLLKKVTRGSDGVVDETINNYCIKKGIDSDTCSEIEHVEYEEEGIDYISTMSEFTVTFDNITNRHIITIDLNEEINNDTVEIRIIPIRGPLSVSNSLSDMCKINKLFIPIKIYANANCNDTYRGEEMFLPGSGMLGYSTLFDYGIYDTGLFQP